MNELTYEKSVKQYSKNQGNDLIVSFLTKNSFKSLEQIKDGWSDKVHLNIEKPTKIKLQKLRDLMFQVSIRYEDLIERGCPDTDYLLYFFADIWLNKSKSTEPDALNYLSTCFYNIIHKTEQFDYSYRFYEKQIDFNRKHEQMDERRFKDTIRADNVSRSPIDGFDDVTASNKQVNKNMNYDRGLNRVGKKHSVETIKKLGGKSVRATHSESGEVREYDSCNKLFKDLGGKIGNIKKCLDSDKLHRKIWLIESI